MLKFLTTLMTRSVTSTLSRPALAPMDLQAAGIAMAGTASCAVREAGWDDIWSVARE